ncbi:hypothetical protein ACFE04_004979 [Oxalis oulophora]
MEKPIVSSDTDTDQVSRFIETGVYRFSDPNVVFIDPVRILNGSYSHYQVSPNSYYSRFFQSKLNPNPNPNPNVIETEIHSIKKRKRNNKKKSSSSSNNKPQLLNEREVIAEQRHNEVRPMLLKAHEALMKQTQLLHVIENLTSVSSRADESRKGGGDSLSFVELGNVWQSSLYQITLRNLNDADRYSEQSLVPAFNNLVMNDTGDDIEAEFLDRFYVLPRDSRFYMLTSFYLFSLIVVKSDLKQIHNLIPAESGCGFNLIVIDPPWENASAYQKSMYPTLPNRYFLTIPIKQLAHKQGALVALWVTNREKLRSFVEKELFPTWNVTYVSTFYWLKVKADGLLVSDLDLFHHRPYECLLLGYCQGEESDSNYLSRLVPLVESKVIMSIPGDFSRKPPVGDFLLEHAPCVKPGRFIELFAREMNAGWLSWGNEPLRFQESKHFSRT